MIKIRYTNKAKQMTAKAIASLVMSENDYINAVSTWRNNNQNVCSLKAQILGGISPDHLIELGLAELLK